MTDLFGNRTKEKLPIPDADVTMIRALELGQNSERLLNTLITKTPWRSEKITLWGKERLQPRLTAWYADSNLSYSYSGIRLHPENWTGTMQEIRRCVEAASGFSFNSVLLNYYRDNNDSMGMHSDDEPELGRNPTIASLSLGDERIFVLKHKRRKDIKEVKLPLPNESLLIMKGPTQRNWKHGVFKESVACGPRINLTFRQIRLAKS